MSNIIGPGSWRYGRSSRSRSGPETLNGSSAAGVTIQGLIVVAVALAWNGPRGRYSQVWISRADQSFSKTYPKIIVSASATLTGRPIVDGNPTTAPISSSKSNRRQGANSGASRPGGLSCPQGR